MSIPLCPEARAAGPQRIQQAFAYPARPFCTRGTTLVEIGPGRGDFLFHLAETHPDALIVGIEIKQKRVDKLIRRIERRRLHNVRLIQDDARTALPRAFDEASVDEIHIQFPDPWPKRRHGKHRSMSRAFVEACARVLKTGGTISFVTDHGEYAKAVAEVFAAVPGLTGCYASPIVETAPDAFPTFFAEKWKAMGRSITYQRYQRVV